MTQTFCTLTDKNFVYKCLALYDSIEEHMPGSILWVLCLDNESLQLFGKLQKKGVRTISLDDLSDSELLATKEKRTKQEFAWTCKPALMDFVINKKGPSTLVFVDSDLIFYSPIDALFTNHKDASILLTSHKFSQKKSHLSDLVGYFNSGFIVFRNDKTTQLCLAQWKKQCTDWCYNYHDKGRHGDQSYLKTWPHDFKNIEEIPEKGVNLGTWNIERYIIKKTNTTYTVDNETLFCYHFHGFITYLKNDTVCPYPITIHHKAIYREYISRLQIAQNEIRSVDPTWKYGFALPLSLARIIKQELTRIVRNIWQ